MHSNIDGHTRVAIRLRWLSSMGTVLVGEGVWVDDMHGRVTVNYVTHTCCRKCVLVSVRASMACTAGQAMDATVSLVTRRAVRL